MRRLSRAVCAAAAASSLLVILLVYRWQLQHDGAAKFTVAPQAAGSTHPIMELVAQAARHAEAVETQQPQTLAQACDRYTAELGRLPPPGFAEWWEYSRARGVVFTAIWGPIMDDLRPYWGIEPREIRRRAQRLRHNPDICQIQVRNHATGLSHDNARGAALEALIQPFVAMLPDMDINVNQFDEPRVLVPHATVAAALQAEAATRQVAAAPVVSQWSPYEPDAEAEAQGDVPWTNYGGRLCYGDMRAACPADSPAYAAPLVSEEQLLHNEPLADEFEAYAARQNKQPGSFVSNASLAMDMCLRPDLQALHGAFLAPNSAVTSHEFVPVFSECKLSGQNDIVFPATMYYRKDARYDYVASGDVGWNRKKDAVFWRGVPSGGYANEYNWHHMQRPRLIAMLNATKTHMGNVLLPDKDDYTMQNVNVTNMLAQHADTGFTEIVLCGNKCDEMSHAFATVPGTSMEGQFAYKYLIDVDGQSFSARFQAFQFSKSLAIKQTAYREWHDSRLVPWFHYAPLDASYNELFSILAFFLGLEGRMAPQDELARRIAAQGSAWANKVLRREDMESYVFLLLLEYARVFDDKRDAMGYVAAAR